MKSIFSGKKKWLTIPVAGILALAFLPFAVGVGLAYFIHKRVGNKGLRYGLFAVVGLLTIFFGTAWVASFSTDSKSTKIEQVQQTSIEQATDTQAAQQVSSTPTITEESEEEDTKTGKQEAKVVRVVDGDTIEVSFNGKTETVRFIGINTPETVDPRKPVECYGERASAAAKEMLTSETVWLESDPSQSDRDKYNRLLRYVWTDDAVVDFGKVMISTGFAYEYTYDVPYKYQAVYKQSQKDAEQKKLGLWADNACPVATIKPTSAPTQSQSSGTSTSTSGGGACKYSCTSPDRDCSDFSSHAEAQAFFNCCGFTVTSDPMKLDSVGVGDGVACESI